MNAFGLITVDKPIGPTSHKVVSVVRNSTGVRKVGHAGTLDPRASGVLVLCLGSATRLSEFLSTATKRYEAVVRFGSSTETFDAEGDFVQVTGAAPRIEDIREQLPDFRGDIEQVPPAYSAVKVKGRKAYEIARAGEEIELEPREVTIYKLSILDYNPPDLVLDIECSAGTYIRSIANDLGEQLSTGAHLANLRRTKAGPFTLEDCVPLTQLEMAINSGEWQQYLRRAVEALPELPIIEVRGEELKRVTHGNRIPMGEVQSEMASAVGPDGDIVAILEAVEGNTLWHPRKVFSR
ncbi:MAG: tRNA pseudouridine(55) synthase TruB [Anaerolineales bacterium]|jgi:tRNA pseudouridine55 synthase